MMARILHFHCARRTLRPDRISVCENAESRSHFNPARPWHRLCTACYWWDRALTALLDANAFLREQRFPIVTDREQIADLPEKDRDDAAVALVLSGCLSKRAVADDYAKHAPTIKRSEFDAKAPRERAQFMSSGGRVVD